LVINVYLKASKTEWDKTPYSLKPGCLKLRPIGRSKLWPIRGCHPNTGNFSLD
jgi:hypothetical protein